MSNQSVRSHANPDRPRTSRTQRHEPAPRERAHIPEHVPQYCPHCFTEISLKGRCSCAD